MSRQRSFNGAATCSLRNATFWVPASSAVPALQWGRNLFVAECPRMSRIRSPVRRGFNGAATCSLRNGRGTRRPSGGPGCFNGAATCSLRNGVCGVPQSKHRRRASMGPQLVRCGMWKAGMKLTNLCQLQWGRNLFVAECKLALAYAPIAVPASMGPQLVRCGMCSSYLARGMMPPLLQWGRNLFVAECPRPRRTAILATWLQWGRNLFVAECERNPADVCGF